MRLHVLSDLHLEFTPFHPPAVDADVVVLAGDIGLRIKGLRMAAERFASRPVVYVAGNHEYYRAAIPQLTEHMAHTADELGMHFLENRQWVCQGVRFLGCTLWTDFALLGSGPPAALAMEEAGMCLSDYDQIRFSPDSRLLLPQDTRQFHLQSRRFLEQALAQPFTGPTVVVTHHAPTPRSLSSRYRSDVLSAAFASDLSGLIERFAPALWIHGHTHHGVDYGVGTTRVVSNQRGYPAERCGFRPGLVVKV